MFARILVPTDGSPLSGKAVQGAIELARLAGGRIIAISVAEPYAYPPLWEGALIPDQNLYETQLQKFAQMNVDQVAEAALQGGVPFEGHVALSFEPYQAIVNTARDHHCDVILMASHGRKGLNKLFLGSETQKVLAHSSIPVMVFR